MSDMNVERIQQALREADRTQLAEYSKGAEKQRAAFLQQFPRERWARLKLTDYALGHDKNDDNVCRWIGAGVGPQVSLEHQRLTTAKRHYLGA